MKKKPAHTHVRSDDGNAFLRDPGSGPARVKDDLAEGLAENFLASATSGEEQGEAANDAVVEEELGGPFVPSTGKKEFAKGRDRSNPKSATREPFPTTSAPKKD